MSASAHRISVLSAALLALAVFAADPAWADERLVNGGFESGNFTGWTVTANTTIGCQTDWHLDLSGNTGCLPRAAPIEGVWAAYNSFDGGGPLVYDLEQSFLWTGGTTELRWEDTITWSFSGALPRTFTIEFLDGLGVSLGVVHTHTAPPLSNGDLPWTAHLLDVTPTLAGHEGETLTIRFRVTIPESFTGPGGMGLDAVSLVTTDVTPPTVSCSVTRKVLWPAGLGLLDVGLQITAADDSGVPPTTSVQVFSDEAVGALAPDATFAASVLRCRAERTVGGGANGRIYLVVVRATDGAGNTSTATATVVVPLNLTVLHLTGLLTEAASAQATWATTGLPPVGWVPVFPIL